MAFNGVDYGVFQAQIDGTYYEVGEGEFTYSFLNTKSTQRGGSNHFELEKVPSTMTMTVLKGAGFDYRKLVDAKDITVQARTESGQTVRLQHCRYTGDGNNDCKTALFSATFSAGAYNGKIL